MTLKQLTIIILSVFLFTFFSTKKEENKIKETSKFNHFVKQFSNIKALRYKIPSIEELSLKEKKLVYFLTQAGVSGRDIMWNQNHRHNLSTISLS